MKWKILQSFLASLAVFQTQSPKPNIHFNHILFGKDALSKLIQLTLEHFNNVWLLMLIRLNIVHLKHNSLVCSNT